MSQAPHLPDHTTMLQGGNAKLHLTHEEIVEASGAHRRAKQLAWFARLGVPAVMGDDGRVKVLRAAYYGKMMPSIGGNRARSKTEPRLDLLKKVS